MKSADPLAFLIDTPDVAARRLLGCQLIYQVDGHKLAGRIVETEAYHQTDAASHSYKGPTPRTDVMFGLPGHLYVYFTYGMHYCCNVVTGPEGEGSAVLIRALEPLQGFEQMASHRRSKGGPMAITTINLTNGPAKVCQAFAVDKRFNGHDLHQLPLQLLPGEPLLDSQIVHTTRIGISRAKDMPWRFYEKDNPYVSKR
jgi:DNA-3-methyladenine glycosylase